MSVTNRNLVQAVGSDHHLGGTNSIDSGKGAIIKNLQRYLPGLLRALWLSGCVSVLTLFTCTYNTTTHRDNDIVLTVFLVALTLPVGLLAMYLISALAVAADMLFHISILADGRLGMLETGILLVVAGWLQWFVIVPKLVAVIRIRKNRLNTGIKKDDS